MTQIASAFISQTQFCEIIELMREQYVADKKHSEAFAEIFSGDVGLYDNSKLVKACMLMLREYFPVDEDGHCPIEFYCYVQNFGKLGDEYESPQDFYNRLLIIYTHY